MTRLLLDTHILLWWLQDPSLLKNDARLSIANPRNVVLVSSASILEIAIKQSIGKLKLAASPEDFLQACRFHELPFSIAHASAVRNLPDIHKDPFDRMLIAQAQVETLILVSRDPLIERYQIALLAA